ncbi:hypothetical protein HYR54_05415 [Candidatus Acetothermia bacterium]|nr:hypothetical protein [Candidatus Acetothermia bacterium]
MNTLWWIAALVVLSLVLVVYGWGPSNGEAAVRASFNSYKAALKAHDGKAAVTFVDKNTLNYYDKMLDLALRGTRESVLELSILDKLMVLTIRHNLPLELVKQMSSKSFFVYSVKEGLIADNSTINGLRIEHIMVSGTTASGDATTTGGKVPPNTKWIFHKEDGHWKLDLTSIFPVINWALEQAVHASGLSVEEFLFKILKSISGKPVKDAVWEPLIK